MIWKLFIPFYGMYHALTAEYGVYEFSLGWIFFTCVLQATYVTLMLHYLFGVS